jgi:hypothetical protein
MARLISLHGSKERYLLNNLGCSKFCVPRCLISFLSCLSLQCQSDFSISAELRQVAKGFDYKVSSFNTYDVNGYRFHTTSYEKSRPNRKTTNTGVFTPGVVTPGAEQEDYYGTVEEIYELEYHGENAPKPVIFKCQWFNPAIQRKNPKLGIVETRQDSLYLGDDVYIVAQQARQVYYCPYANTTDTRLQGWYIVHKVSPHGKLPRPNDDDYNLNPPTHDGEFYQQDDGLPGMFEIDLTGEIDMEVDEEWVEEWVVDEEAADEVHDPRDIEMLDGLQLGNDSDEDEDEDDLEALGSDDDTYRADNPDYEEY